MFVGPRYADFDPVELQVLIGGLFFDIAFGSFAAALGAMSPGNGVNGKAPSIT